MRSQLLAAPAQPIWLVERGPTGKTRLDGLATDPSVVERFRPAGRWTYTESLHLLYLVPV
ncbi:MAG: hypothetical protein H0U29_13885 [Acidimicrobiia bacterium]|nr:hypothetical protein [Acidimicrobiia bacterium]